jgi:hypothetical protein
LAEGSETFSCSDEANSDWSDLKKEFLPERIPFENVIEALGHQREQGIGGENCTRRT